MRRTITLVMAALLAVGLIAGPAAAKGDKAPGDSSIVEIALAVNADTGEFSTLIAALVEADLVGALAGDGQYTVFAPTDAAFAALGLDAGNIGDLPTDALTDILLYHVTDGRRFSNSVVNANNSKAIEMLNGGYIWTNPDLSITAGSSTANLVPSLVNINASNGVIHVVDAVLLP